VHLQVVTSLLEGREVCLSEIICMVRHIMRQPSIGWPAGSGYNAPYRDDPPP
jgi:hypothetical protein